MSDDQKKRESESRGGILNKIFSADGSRAEDFEKRRLTYLSGWFLVYGAGGLFFFGVIGFLGAGAERARLAEPHLEFSSFFSFYFREILVAAASVTALIMGNRLLRQVGINEQNTIPERDRDLVAEALKQGNEDVVRLYIQLRSLTGFTGGFTKLGLTGLPLTTVALTVFFSLLSFSPGTVGTNFLDLAKLTLGAFIGSFVQRQVEGRKQEGEINKVIQRITESSASGATGPSRTT